MSKVNVKIFQDNSTNKLEEDINEFLGHYNVRFIGYHQSQSRAHTESSDHQVTATVLYTLDEDKK